jgi:hypothetical protein
MKRTLLLALALSSLLPEAGCGHYPAPIRSFRDVRRTSSTEYMVVIVDLPLEEWPKLQKFTGLEHFRVAQELAGQITDQHLQALSRLKLPRLRQISFAHCSKITDAGLLSLTNLPSIQGFQLIGASITDRGILTLATQFPALAGINVENCTLVTEHGFLALTNSRTITEVSLSLEPFSQAQIENIISNVSNVRWWTISDPDHKLDEARLRELGTARKITIQVADENRYVHSITLFQPEVGADGHKAVRSNTNSASSPGGRNP